MASRDFYVQPADYGSGWREAAQMIGDYRQNQDQQAYQEAAKKAATEAMQSGDPRKIREAVIQFPEISKTMTDMFGFTNDQTKQVAKDTYRKALSDPQNAAQYLQEGISQVSQFGGRPTTMAADFQMFQQNPEAALKNMRVGYAGIASEEEYGAMFGEDENMGGPTPAAIRVFEANAKAAGLEPGTPEYIRAAQIELGLQPRAGISAQERIAGDPSLSAQVAASSGREAGATESAKLDAQLSFKPAIAEAVKIAEASAKSRGESLSEVARAKASLPGLTEVVNKLITLSDVATYTLAGKAFDEVAKQLGFGATEGATARAKMESLVSNQILPLLRDTFGAQFTEREGESLRKTMLDIDASPAQKKEILNAFIEQKIRDIETKESNLNQQAPAGQSPQRIRLDANGNIIQ